MRMRIPRFDRRVAGLALLAAFAATTFIAAPARIANAQTPYYPYFGKNLIHYDTFKWKRYETEHFTIYYYPEIEQHLERLAGYAESAYEKISADLTHELAEKVPLILFKTHSEFEQQNVAPPDASSEGVAAFAESERGRILMPIDEPSDRLYGLIVHELTHQFNNSIVPPGLIRRSTPLWVNEGLADWERGEWDPLDLMSVRDAAVADIVPRMSRLEGYGGFGNPRLIYNLGHAVFEFVEARFGKEGIRAFLFALRKSVIGAGDDAYEEAFQMTPDEFDQAFERYLKDRFKPFRDKERPADYGSTLSPNAERTRFNQSLSIAPSPAGGLLATITGNQKDGEVDIVLVSTKDGSVIENLTPGFDKDLGFSHVIIVGERFNTVPWMSWSPDGNRLAFFVRTEKERTLIILDPLTKKILDRVPMKTVDAPESPAFSPDGRTIVFSGIQNAIGDLFQINLQTREITNLTKDAFADFAPVYSPDGKFIVFNARISGNQKLYRLDLMTGAKTQLTFGPTDETGAQFIDNNTLVFSSTATDPAKPLDAEVANNARIYNIWTLDLGTKQLRQYTDALGGNVSPVVLRDKDGQRIAFVTYYKGDWQVHSIRLRDPLNTSATEDHGPPALVDFQPPSTHTLIQANIHDKRRFEKMFIQGVPAVNVMVSNNGDVFGGTAIQFGDVLGDQQFLIYADSSAQYSSSNRTLLFNWTNRANRIQYALEARAQTMLFYANQGNIYDPVFSPLFNRGETRATATEQGGSAFVIYPFNRYQRLEMSVGAFRVRQSYDDATIQSIVGGPAEQVFRNGFAMPVGFNFIQETTIFREFGPLAGNTVRLGYYVEPPVGDLSSQTFEVDARYYARLATSGVFAVRFRGFKSIGEDPRQLYFGGNSEMRGYDYLQFLGNNVYFANAELRFPIIDAALTPIGVVGALRGVFFFNIGAGWYNDEDFSFVSNGSEVVRPVIDTVVDQITGRPVNVFGDEVVVDGIRLRDARASYGVGLQTSMLGFPMHFDWAWRTLFNEAWEDVLYFRTGGSADFRHPRFSFWMGYDF